MRKIQDSNNLFPNFGLNWQQYHLNPFQLVQDFHRIAPGLPVTLAGNYALGAINQGNDRIRLRPEFAFFVIGHVAALD
jgi:ABC-type arginine transport system ATPase subunit